LIAHEPEAQVVAKATPLLAPMIEEGWLHNQVSQDVIDAYLSDTGFAGIDALILGCTHYPLIKDQIADSLLRQQEQSVAVVDSSVAVAEYVRNRLQALHALCHDMAPPQHRYFLSALSGHFRASAQLFLGKNVEFEQGNWAR
jgi:glutamate racemase